MNSPTTLCACVRACARVYLHMTVDCESPLMTYNMVHHMPQSLICQVLALHDNKISRIAPRVFEPLTKLRSLCASVNSISCASISGIYWEFATHDSKSCQFLLAANSTKPKCLDKDVEKAPTEAVTNSREWCHQANTLWLRSTLVWLLVGVESSHKLTTEL